MNRPTQTQTQPVSDAWFSVEPCAHDILRIREPNIHPYAAGDMFLLRGQYEALLVDTGTGMVPPAPLVNAIAMMPVTAVALGWGYDHAGGWAGFEARACHPTDAPFLNERCHEQDDIFDYLNDWTVLAVPHAGYRLDDYAMRPAPATRLVYEGDRFNLGGRVIEIMHLPGRGAGGLCLWEVATGSLFTSDMLYDGDHGLAWPPERPRDYCASLRRMRDLPVETVFAGHYGPFGRARMLEIIDAQLADLETATHRVPA